MAGTTTPTTPDPTKTDTTKPDAAPETYADFTLPEGAAVAPDTLKDATAIFKELNLSQDAAQKLVDLYVKDTTKSAAAPAQAHKDMISAWRNDVLKDPNLASGDGLRSDVNENIGKAKAMLGSDMPKFNELMNMSGLGNHPVIVAALNTWGKSQSEGKHVEGKGPSPEGQKPPGAPRPSAAAALFPNLKSATQ